MQTIFSSFRRYLTDHEMSVFYLFSMLFGMLGALIIAVFIHLFERKDAQIGTVNITGLVDHYIKQEADKNLPSDVLKKEVKHYGMSLNKELQQLSKERQVILMPSEAVIVGSHDYTAYINQRLLDKDDHRNE
jgi:hypothetical protein